MPFNLFKNSVWAVGEVLASALVLFFLYKIIIGNLGIEALGIWSLVMAATSLGRLADIGTAAGLGRFVAAAQANKDQEKILHYAETAIFTNLALYTVIALLLWAPAHYGLSLFMDGENLEKGQKLLPFALISFVQMSLAGATMGALIGQHRADQKSMVTLMGLIIQFSVAIILVPSFGLLAVAWAQIAQYAFIMSASWLLFLRNYHGRYLIRLPCRWSRAVLKELLGFGIRLQAVTIVSLLYEPLVKFIMSSLGGLEALGYFEMAQRLVLQVRQLVVMPLQPVVPSFAHLSETAQKKIPPFYHRSVALAISFGFPLLGGTAMTAPLISYLWVGNIEMTFVWFVIILSCGWIFNLVAAPAFLMGIGLGRIKGNFYGSVLTVGGAAVLCYFAGHLAGAYGVAIAASTTLAVGSLLTMLMNCKIVHVTPLPGIQSFYEIWEDGIKIMMRLTSKKGKEL